MTRCFKRKRTWSAIALIAFSVFGLFFLYGGTGQARDVGRIPIPAAKPITTESINLITLPLPDKKPEAFTESSEFQKPIVVAYNVELEKELVQKPQQEKRRFFFRSKKPEAVLSDRHVETYKEIFNLERNNEFKKSDREIKRLKNDVLVGHILAERYLNHSSYRASYEDLIIWLKRYGDHPQAQEIYKLAQNQLPEGQAPKIQQPKLKSILSGQLGNSSHQRQFYQTTKQRNAAQQNDIQKLAYEVNKYVKRYQPTTALATLNDSKAAKFLDDVEYDELRSQIAAGYLYAQKFKEAKSLAKASWKRSGDFVPLSGWVYGLTLWQENKYNNAAKAFETTAASPYASGWLVSAAAYWGGRSYDRLKKAQEKEKLFELSSSYSHTFYGILSARTINKSDPYNWQTPSFGKEEKRLISKTKSGQRAIALLEIGRKDLAEKELLLYKGTLSRADKKAFIALVSHYDLPSLQMRLASLYSKESGALYDSALYPWAPWQPDGGYRLDKALVHAFVRQESRFDNKAENNSGATGLMQLMPRTASYIAGNDKYLNNTGRQVLKSPSVNLSLGQDYIIHLLEHPAVQGDLMSLAIAYNAGPGKLSGWKKERKDIDDPLFFIETIPYAETRAFVERVLANYWIYKDKSGEDRPSLLAVANGNWAPYAGQLLPKSTSFAER